MLFRKERAGKDKYIMLKVLFTDGERKEINRRPESQDPLCQPPGACLSVGARPTTWTGLLRKREALLTSLKNWPSLVTLVDVTSIKDF